MKEIALTEIPKVKVGQTQDYEGLTGCTVLLFDEVATAGVDIRGGGPAARETALLSPLAMAPGIHGLVLSGGSAFGLAAADGVMQYLEERNIGFDVGVTKVPLVPQSCLFDLMIGDYKARPTAKMGYEACKRASKEPPENGCVGAGTGCTVGKYLGIERAMKSGIGFYGVALGDIYVGAVVAVNALGDIFDVDSGVQVAGLLSEDKKSLASTQEAMWVQIAEPNRIFASEEVSHTNTTIGAIITNAKFSKAELTKIAGMGHNGLARSIKPVHTMADGDSLYAVSVGDKVADINALGSVASYVVAKAVAKGVKAATSMGNFLSYRDLNFIK